jgi:hypothetical protein
MIRLPQNFISDYSYRGQLQAEIVYLKNQLEDRSSIWMLLSFGRQRPLVGRLRCPECELPTTGLSHNAVSGAANAHASVMPTYATVIRADFRQTAVTIEPPVEEGTGETKGEVALHLLREPPPFHFRRVGRNVRTELSNVCRTSSESACRNIPTRHVEPSLFKMSSRAIGAQPALAISIVYCVTSNRPFSLWSL